MKIHEIRADDHEPRETRNLNIGIYLIQVIEAALNRAAVVSNHDKQTAVLRSIARQIGTARVSSE